MYLFFSFLVLRRNIKNTAKQNKKGKKKESNERSSNKKKKKKKNASIAGNGNLAQLGTINTPKNTKEKVYRSLENSQENIRENIEKIPREFLRRKVGKNEGRKTVHMA